MREITTKVYQYEELNDEAKEKARDWYREGALDYEWWDGIYEGASEIGLKITGFDLDRNRHTTGEFTIDAEVVAENIMKNHGVNCETYKTASNFLYDFRKIAKEMISEEDQEDKKEELAKEFEKSLLEDYSIILQHEYEWLLSDEQVAESIIANEYEFTDTGKRI